MREIKYRIPWRNSDGSFSGFTYWGRIDHKNEPSAECFTSPGQWGGRRAGSDEQFTGLRDKNGKEIYEGDIVRDMHPFEKNRHSDEVVEYEGGGFSPIAIPGWEGTPQVEYLEVIGNIHENPELLK